MGGEGAVCGCRQTTSPNVQGAPEAPDAGAQWRGRGQVPVRCPDGEGAADEPTTGGGSSAENEVKEGGGDEEGVDRRDGEEGEGVGDAVCAEEAIEREKDDVC